MYDTSVSTHKQRLSTTVDSGLLAAVQEEVAAGNASSVSSWVNEALRLKIVHDRRLAALDRFLDAYEAEAGEITDQEIDEASRRARSRAVVVRGESGRSSRRVTA